MSEDTAEPGPSSLVMQAAGRSVMSDRYCNDPEVHGFPCLCAAGPYATYWTMAACGGDETWPGRPRPQLPLAMIAAGFLTIEFAKPPPPLADRVDPSMPSWLAKAGLECKLSRTLRDLAAAIPCDFSIPREPDRFMSPWERHVIGFAASRPPFRLSSVV